jgi:uncharacterized protein (TIGR03492 family)
LKRILLLSNGHGEDLSGALLGKELLRQSRHRITALPLVGHGEPYRQAGIAVLGRTRAFSTGGLGYTSLRGRITELLQGQVFYLLRQLLRLWRHRRHTDLVVIVGDVVPLLAWWLTGLPGVVYLVAYSSHYEGQLRLPWPCGWILQRRRLRHVWSRDALTAADLSRQLGRRVTFLGNPFLDLVVAAPGEKAQGDAAGAPPPAGLQRVALLPGSRLPEAEQNLELMLRMLSLLPAPLQRRERVLWQAALVRDLEGERLAALAERLGWQSRIGSGTAWLEQGPLRLELVWGGFAAVLRPCDAVVAMAGTATEQAVGLGKPVLQLAGQGPQFTAGFAEAQRRLLGPGVICAEGEVGTAATLRASARLLSDLLAGLADPREGEALRRRLAQVGRERIGTLAGTERMAAAIMAGLPPDPSPRHG